jgi:hypothetical protein
LEGDLETLEKTCSDMALAYFKALLRKREADVLISKLCVIFLGSLS